MSDVAVLKNKDSDVQYYTVADATAISKGTMLVLSSDPRTAIAHSAEAQIPVGIAVEDKVANDGQTRIGVRTRGIFDMVADGAITLGDIVVLGSAVNDVKTLPTVSGSLAHLKYVVGRCLETASDNEVVEIAVMIS